MHRIDRQADRRTDSS